MNPEAVQLRSSDRPKLPRVASETWALVGLALVGLMALAWFGVFAWVNAKAIGLI
jgi:hypothetical protein